MLARVLLAALLAFACAPSRRADSTDTADPDAGDVIEPDPTCSPGEALCGDTCLFVDGNDEHCGRCDAACGGGFVCSAGKCVAAPGDCREAGATCPARTWCDPANGRCRPGCSRNADCAAEGYCDLEAHACRCNEGKLQCGTLCLACTPPPNAAATCAGARCAFACAADFHRCDDACAPDRSVDSCGTACEPCPAPPGGTATCDGTRCGMACPAGARLCDGACVECPRTGVAETACEGGACVASTCQPLHVLETGKCRQAWTVQSIGSASQEPVLAVSQAGAPAIGWTTTYPSSGDESVKLWRPSTGTKDLALTRLMDLAFDPTGTLHVLANNRSYQLSWTAGPAASEVVGNSWGLRLPRLVVDANGTPYVAGYVDSSSAPRGLLRTASGWVTETPGSFKAYGTQLALASDGRVFALFETDSAEAVLARREASGWVADAPIRGRVHAALALRSDAVPAYAWVPGSGGKWLSVANGGASERVTTTVAPGSIDLALDARDTPHVVYSASNDGVFYATKSGGAWRHEWLGARDSYGSPSVGVGADGVVHVTWLTHDGRSVMYATRR